MLVYQYVSARSNSWQLLKRNVTKPYRKMGFCVFRVLGYNRERVGFLKVRVHSRPATALTFDISFGARIRLVDYGWE